MRDCDDHNLVRLFQGGNEEERQVAFTKLYERHEKSLRWYLTRMTKDRSLAADIAQEAFRKALGALDDYEPGASFKTWLFQIATNTMKNYIKKKRPDSGLKEQFHTSKSTHPDEAVQNQETAREVREAVDRLSEKLRAALVLVQFEGLKYKQAANVLDISMSALKARMSRAYQQLKDILQEES